MKYRTKDFKMSEEFILRIYHKDGLDSIPYVCALTHVPCIVAYKFIVNYDGNEEALNKIKELSDFYKGVTVE